MFTEFLFWLTILSALICFFFAWRLIQDTEDARADLPLYTRAVELIAVGIAVSLMAAHNCPYELFTTPTPELIILGNN